MPTTRCVRNLGVLFINTRDSLGADVAVHLLLASQLAADGLRVWFATNSASAASPSVLNELAREPRIHALRGNLGRPLSGVAGRLRVASIITNALAVITFWRLAWLVWAERLDIIHSTDRPRDALFATLLGMMTRRPAVIHMHSNYDERFSRLTRWAFGHAACVLCVSRFTARALLRAGVPRRRLTAILSAVDPAHFNPDDAESGRARARWSIPVSAPLIGIIGRLIPFKGHEDLFRALALVRDAYPDAHLLVVGGDYGEYAAALRAQAALLGLCDNVRFVGVQADVRPVYADLDVLAVPSWDEPFGLVVAEALAMRVPVVAYRAGGIPEIVRPGADGLLVTPRSVEELAAALIKLLANPTLRKRMGEAGRQRVLDHFRPERQATEVAELYRRLVAPERAAAVARADGERTYREPTVAR